MSTLNLTKYGNSHCLRCPCRGGFELKFFTDLIVLPSIIGKEKYVASVLYKYLLECLFLFIKFVVHFQQVCRSHTTKAIECPQLRYSCYLISLSFL